MVLATVFWLISQVQVCTYVCVLYHLSICPQMFDNISKLRFEQGSSGEPLANAMISGEGEMMEYRQGVVAEGKVEDWMTQV